MCTHQLIAILAKIDIKLIGRQDLYNCDRCLYAAWVSVHSVGALVTTLNPAKTTESVAMLFVV